jgi:hypothetical protein
MVGIRIFSSQLHPPAILKVSLSYSHSNMWVEPRRPLQSLYAIYAVADEDDEGYRSNIEMLKNQ